MRRVAVVLGTVGFLGSAMAGVPFNGPMPNATKYAEHVVSRTAHALGFKCETFGQQSVRDFTLGVVWWKVHQRDATLKTWANFSDQGVQYRVMEVEGKRGFFYQGIQVGSKPWVVLGCSGTRTMK